MKLAAAGAFEHPAKILASSRRDPPGAKKFGNKRDGDTSLLRAHFASLCGQALGPQDYLALASDFHTVFLEAVPQLSAERRNEAARFVSLIDALYEGRVKLVVLAEAEPEGLYPAGDGAFEFERTVSRLQEMRSKSWFEAEG